MTWTQEGLERLARDIFGQEPPPIDWPALIAYVERLEEGSARGPLELRYCEQLTFRRIGEELGYSGSNGARIVCKRLRILRHPHNRLTWDLALQARAYRAARTVPETAHSAQQGEE